MKKSVFLGGEAGVEKGGRINNLHKALGVPHLAVRVDDFFIGPERLVAPVTHRPISIWHVATAKWQKNNKWSTQWTKLASFRFLTHTYCCTVRCTRSAQFLKYRPAHELWCNSCEVYEGLQTWKKIFPANPFISCLFKQAAITQTWQCIHCVDSSNLK